VEEIDAQNWGHSARLKLLWLNDLLMLRALANDRPDTAWVIVDIGECDWSRLAYQFGHELGHVLCISWGSDAKSHPPGQWLAEMFVNHFP
jgi:hypothetical protein